MGEHPKIGQRYVFETDETNADQIVPIDADEDTVTLDVFGSDVDRTVWNKETMQERIENGDLTEGQA